MDILEMTYFRDAANLENFSLVAKKHFVAQSSVSRAIAKLENELGVKLFIRKGNAVALSEYGKLLLFEVEEALAHIDAAVQSISARRSKIVRVSTLAGASAAVPAMAAFRKAHPEIELQFPSRLNTDYAPDIWLSTKPVENPENYKYLELFSERYVIALPKDSPKAAKDSLLIEDLRGIPLVGLGFGSELYRRLLPYFEKHHYHPIFIAQSSNPTTVCDYVRYGFGISIFPERSWARVVGDGIAVRPFSDIELRRSIYLYWKKSVPLTPAVREFIDFFGAYYAAEQKIGK